ncbi:diguanylate cyclase [Alteromonadaceae bacterium BrNp21-10]|nr:diguanylate cyclase [Alteromonadaceae bacterium BrNp21-10]
MSNSVTEMDDFHLKMELLGSIEVGIVVFNQQFEVQVWNEFMQNHSGILPSEIRNKSLFSFFPEIDQEWFVQKTEPVFQLKSPAFIIWEQRPHLFQFSTYRPITSDSDYMYQNVTLFPLTSVSGDVEQIGMVVYDVTDEAISKLRFIQANKELEKISRVDGLTGLFNRRYWEESCELEYKRCSRSSGASSLIILDIDHFKKVNDTHGHPAGDEVIRRIAGIIQKTTRETDLCGRYGGEEFTIILPDTDIDQATLVAERIRRKAESLVVVHDNVDISFTVSVGISAFHESYSSHIEWLESADRNLYTAKESGRNKVVAK